EGNSCTQPVIYNIADFFYYNLEENQQLGTSWTVLHDNNMLFRNLIGGNSYFRHCIRRRGGMLVCCYSGRLSTGPDGSRVLAVPLAAWILSAWWLAQIGGHPIEGGRFSFVETLLQLSEGTSYFFLPRLGRIIGLIALIVFSGALLSCFSKLRSNQTSFVIAFSLRNLQNRTGFALRFVFVLH